MAVRLANPVAVRMRHTPAQFLHPQAFLVCVVAVAVPVSIAVIAVSIIALVAIAAAV